MSESSLSWYYKNKDRSVKRSTEWRKNNRERYLQKRRDNYQKNKNKLQEKSRVRAYNYYHSVRKKLKKENPEKYRKLQRQWNQMRINRWREFLNEQRQNLGGKCSHCQYNKEIKILQFHHVNPAEKYKDIPMIRNKAKALKEIKKCILLCPNCHALHHLKNGYKL